ncbi:MAG: DNA mismatch repair protein MutT [Pseudomonadota bacterium]
MAATETSESREGAERAPRHAATVILIRRDTAEPRVLMGQRGKGAAFMPSKFVFPGGALDAADETAAAAFPPPAPLADRLGAGIGGVGDTSLGAALALTAVRELWEETGLVHAEAATKADPGAQALPEPWHRFAARHGRPSFAGLGFIFRAITPPGRTRRFDARFLTLDAGALACDPDDFSGADEELAHLSWITIAEARALDLPFITEVVLGELEARLALGEAAAARPAPFFHHDGGRSFLDPL